MSRSTSDPARCLLVSCTGLSPSLAGLSRPFHYHTTHLPRSITPERTRSGLGSFHFARRYFGNRVFFLFLALLRCFSSGGSPPHAMDSRTDAWSLSMRVSPFRHPRIIGYLHLPAAFRSLSRLSSALSAKASSLCSFSLDLRCIALHLFLLSKACFGFFTESFDSASDVLIFEISFYIFSLYEVFKVLCLTDLISHQKPQSPVTSDHQ